MKTTVIGAFPKISDQPGGQELRQALHKQDRGELPQAELDATYDRVTAGAIKELEAAGIDVINDGQIRWDDLLAPFASAWTGVHRGPLERFYDNNTYFRQPTIEGPISSDGTTLVRAFTSAKAIATHELKAAVAGPITFATLAIDKHYGSLEERVLAVADAIAAEVRGLGAAGATLVDVEDPGLVYAPQHIELGLRQLAAVLLVQGLAELLSARLVADLWERADHGRLHAVTTSFTTGRGSRPAPRTTSGIASGHSIA